MATITLPPNLLRARSVEWNLKGTVTSGGQTGTGAQTLVRSDGGGLWFASDNDNLYYRKDHIATMRAVRALSNGGSTPIIVPRTDILQPWPIVDGKPLKSYASISHSDGALFSDSSGYTQPVIIAQVAAAADLRAVTLAIILIYGSALRGGECFSINHPTKGWRLYEIFSVELDESGNSIVQFSPPLREAVEVGDPVEFDNPRCLMRAASPSSLDMKLESFSRTMQTMQFIEAFV
jgi:hypothetical protein